MLDNSFTNAVQQWLDTDVSERDITAGAELLLRLNRNRWMYQTIVRKRNFEKLEYELKKHLRIRLDGLTIRDVALMEKKVLPQVEDTLSSAAAEIADTDNSEPTISTDTDVAKGVHAGKRADHDKLPADIQALYERNGEVYFKLKQTFETLKQMHDALPCDRYEYLKVLKELDTEYRKNWERYDNYTEHSVSVEKKNAPADAKKKGKTANRKSKG